MVVAVGTAVMVVKSSPVEAVKGVGMVDNQENKAKSGKLGAMPLQLVVVVVVVVVVGRKVMPILLEGLGVVVVVVVLFL